MIVRAYSEIPDEYLLLEDRLAVSKYLVGLRGCGKHYWVRSNGVPSHLPCEQCGVTRQMEQQVLQGIPEVFPTSTTKEEPPISQYIWKGWRDQRPHSIRIHLISIHLPIHPSIHPSTHPSTYSSIHPFTSSLSINSTIHPSINTSSSLSSPLLLICRSELPGEGMEGRGLPGRGGDPEACLSSGGLEEQPSTTQQQERVRTADYCSGGLSGLIGSPGHRQEQ